VVYPPMIKKCAQQIITSDAILILAGAGLSVESGMPSYLSNSDSFWESFPPFKKKNMTFYDVSNPAFFLNDPHLAWGFYGERLMLANRTIPHEGYDILKKWAETKNNYFVYTSNIDGHFLKANFPDNRIVEAHGSIHHVQKDGEIMEAFKIPELSPPIIKDYRAVNLPYDSDGNVIRPNILMFGDWSWISYRFLDQKDRFNEWINDTILGLKKLVILEIGTGISSVSMRKLTHELVKAHAGLANVIRINIKDSEIEEPHIGLQLSSLNAIKMLDQSITEEKKSMSKYSNSTMTSYM